MKNPRRLPLVSSLAIIACSPLSQAAIIASHTDDFSGGGGASAATGKYSLTNAANSTFTLEISTIADGTFLGSAANDGYGYLKKSVATSQTIGVSAAYGTIAAGDIGKSITIDVAFRSTGITATFAISIDGASVGGQGQMIASSFSLGNAAPTNANYLLSTVPLTGTQTPTPTNYNPTRATPRPLTYTILASDVGKALSLNFSGFDSSSGSTRTVAIDAIRYTVVPEPTAALLGLLGSLAILRRRR